MFRKLLVGTLVLTSLLLVGIVGYSGYRVYVQNEASKPLEQWYFQSKTKIFVYQTKIEKDPIGYIIPGKSFVVLIKEKEWLKIVILLDNKKLGAKGWIKNDPSTYRPLFGRQDI